MSIPHQLLQEHGGRKEEKWEKSINTYTQRNWRGEKRKEEEEEEEEERRRRRRTKRRRKRRLEKGKV